MTSTKTTNYYLRILSRECDVLAMASDGNRHATLSIVAAKIGRAIAYGWMEENESRTALLEAARRRGLPDNEANKIINEQFELRKAQNREEETKHRPRPTNYERLMVTVRDTADYLPRLADKLDGTDRSGYDIEAIAAALRDESERLRQSAGRCAFDPDGC